MLCAGCCPPFQSRRSWPYLMQSTRITVVPSACKSFEQPWSGAGMLNSTKSVLNGTGIRHIGLSVSHRRESMDGSTSGMPTVCREPGMRGLAKRAACWRCVTRKHPNAWGDWPRRWSTHHVLFNTEPRLRSTCTSGAVLTALDSRSTPGLVTLRWMLTAFLRTCQIREALICVLVFYVELGQRDRQRGHTPAVEESCIARYVA
mmetsp:Transcript_77491/g.185796  ORF Transcript_77491/g.185796 Transcript_77491/m.185796 type:complete len:203 (+) Transcript_77491:410-1018(+)